MRLYHFIDCRFGLENICRRRLKISLIESLNDPFELQGIVTTDPILFHRYDFLKSGLAKYMGILCFSASWQNPVQWGHYADRHRGLCLGFDVSGELHKVKYVKRRLRPNPRALEAGGAGAEAHVRRLITTKFRHWRYENEHRLFVSLGDKDDETGLYFKEIGEEIKLREIVVGCHSAVTQKELEQALAGYSNVRLSRSKLALRTFRMDREQIRPDSGR